MSWSNSVSILQKLKASCVASISLLTIISMTAVGCADAVGPDVRNANVPVPRAADERQKGINENGEPVIYLPLGEDVLLPQAAKGDPLPDTIVGPYELRGETLAGALQLILDGVDIPVAFESDSGLSQTITVTNLKGPISQVVNTVCSLANMYCSYSGGTLSVKDREIFTVTIPPIVAKSDVAVLLTNIATAVGSITGETPITDPSTRTIVYRASQRTSEMATRYFQKLRSNTAMIVYETYIWEVALEAGNSTGIKWSLFDKIGRFKFGINLAGASDKNLGTPVSIGLPTMSNVSFTSSDVFQFISTYGAVKTISQPQISVLSGSEAKLRIADKQNYVSAISKTTTQIGDSFSTSTASVDTGFTLNIGSNWDNSTVYGTINILLQEVQTIDTFDENPDAIVQLPQTTERELNTSVRVRPGDMVLIAGLVRENDKFSKDGLGLNKPLIPTSRSASTANTELVFLLRPRVVVFTTPTANTPRKGDIPLLSEAVTSEADMSAVDTVPMPPVAAVVTPTPEPATEPEFTPTPAPISIAPTSVVPAPVIEAKPLASDDMSVEPPQFAKTRVPLVRTASTPVITPANPLPIVADKVEEPSTSSIEIQPLSSVVDQEKKKNSEESQDSSVTVNYDMLGR